MLSICKLIDDLAIGKFDGTLGTRGQIIVVSDHEDRFSGLRQVLKEMEDHFGGLRIQVAGRLIRGEQDRIVCQGAGNGHTLLLSAGQGIGKTVRLVCHAHQLEQVHGALGSLGGGDIVLP